MRVDVVRIAVIHDVTLAVEVENNRFIFAKSIAARRHERDVVASTQLLAAGARYNGMFGEVLAIHTAGQKRERRAHGKSAGKHLTRIRSATATESERQSKWRCVIHWKT